MRLTDHTDYSLRVLMYLNRTRKLVTLGELAKSLKISRNNLIKVSGQLAKRGLIDASRGKSGGVIIRSDAGQVSLREIISYTEENFHMAECFSGKTTCTFLIGCELRQTLQSALAAFMAELEKKTLDDITPGRRPN
jgi:Rrf2 family nitric oxide-sensitive transcriptional repressor